MSPGKCPREPDLGAGSFEKKHFRIDILRDLPSLSYILPSLPVIRDHGKALNTKGLPPSQKKHKRFFLYRPCYTANIAVFGEKYKSFRLRSFMTAVQSGKSFIVKPRKILLSGERQV